MELVQLQVPGASRRSRLARAARAAPAPGTVSGWQGSDRLPAASPASVCKHEFQPALKKLVRPIQAISTPWEKKRASVQLSSNKSVKEAIWVGGRNAPKGRKKQKLKPDDDQP